MHRYTVQIVKEIRQVTPACIVHGYEALEALIDGGCKNGVLYGSKCEQAVKENVTLENKPSGTVAEQICQASNKREQHYLQGNIIIQCYLLIHVILGSIKI